MTAAGTCRAPVAADARPGAAAVAVRGLAAGYGGPAAGGSGAAAAAAAVIEGVDLELRPGECLAVVGRSGCGKTTLLGALAGLLTPLAGEVLVDGVVVAAADGAGSAVPGCRAGHAAYMFQDDLLLPWKTALGNAVFAAQVAPGVAAGLEERAAALLEEVGLGAALDALPRELSGGMRQRVALARTLLLGRGLVLLDEPFGSLDALTRAEVRLWLLRAMVAHPATWVLVTHDVGEAVLLGDRVAVLRGRPAHLEPPSLVPLDREARLRIAAAEAEGAEPPEDAAPDRAALLEAAARLRAALGSRDVSETTCGLTGRRREVM